MYFLFKALLEDKKCKLEEQLSEAKRLKESIDRRSSGIADFLQTHLNTETYEDYQHFVKMKAKLIMDSRSGHSHIITFTIFLFLLMIVQFNH